MEYLKCSNPDLYSKAVMLDLERANYESSVRLYQTKDEVRQFHTQTLMSILSPSHDPEQLLILAWK
jgi:hypothetical protein